MKIPFIHHFQCEVSVSEWTKQRRKRSKKLKKKAKRRELVSDSLDVDLPDEKTKVNFLKANQCLLFLASKNAIQKKNVDCAFNYDGVFAKSGSVVRSAKTVESA